MKQLTYLFSLVGLALIISCNHQQQKTIVNTSHLKQGKYCYAAQFEKDSASLNFEIDTFGKIKGQLYIKYYNKDSVTFARQPTTGNVTGEFRGDTLFADYNFTSGPKGKTKYINPVALLHKGDTLIMGKGIIYYYLGRTYFDNKTAINFSKSKFRFLPVDWKE